MTEKYGLPAGGVRIPDEPLRPPEVRRLQDHDALRYAQGVRGWTDPEEITLQLLVQLPSLQAIALSYDLTGATDVEDGSWTAVYDSGPAPSLDRQSLVDRAATSLKAAAAGTVDRRDGTWHLSPDLPPQRGGAGRA